MFGVFFNYSVVEILGTRSSKLLGGAGLTAPDRLIRSWAASLNPKPSQAEGGLPKSLGAASSPWGPGA